MFRSRLDQYRLAFVIILLAAGQGYGQSNPSTQGFRAGQSMYIVAFRQIQFPIILEDPNPGSPNT